MHKFAMLILVNINRNGVFSKMSTLFWTRFEAICKERKQTPTGVVRACGLSSGNPSAWKAGRVPNMAAIQKIADHFEVSPSYFLEEEQKENSPSGELDKNAIKFALFGTDEITDEKLNEVLRYAAYVRDL